MPTPNKPLPGQQRINDFMLPTPRDTESSDFPKPMVEDQRSSPARESATGAGFFKRRRRIQDNDDDDETIPVVNPKPIQREIIHVHDTTADETDANSSVILLPRRKNHSQHAIDEAAPLVATASTSALRQSGRRRPQPQIREPARTVLICRKYSVILRY